MKPPAESAKMLIGGRLILCIRNTNGIKFHSFEIEANVLRNEMVVRVNINFLVFILCLRQSFIQNVDHLIGNEIFNRKHISSNLQLTFTKTEVNKKCEIHRI